MICKESLELETIWRKRHEVANGLFAVPQAGSSQALTMRQHRAKQAQAASAILIHRKNCHICGLGDNASSAQSLAS